MASNLVAMASILIGLKIYRKCKRPVSFFGHVCQEVFWSIIRHGGQATDEDVLPAEAIRFARDVSGTHEDEEFVVEKCTFT